MPKTRPTIIITNKEFMEDSAKWVKASGEGPVVIVDEDGDIRSTLSRGYYGHTHRFPHQFSEHRDSPQMLSELRDYYCRLNKRGHLGTIHALIEFIEAYAETQGWNLDDYSESNKDE